MAENSSKKPRFLPDPSRWIQTAPSSSTKKTQRPLTALKNGLATPPTTIKRSTPNNQVKKQGSIVNNGFLTPTTNTSSIKKSGNHESATRRGSPSTKGRQDGIPLRKSRLAVRADQRGSSPADDEVDARDGLLRNRPTPTTISKHKAVPLQTHRSAPVTNSSSGMSDALDQDQQTPPKKRQRRRASTLSPLFPPGSPVASHMSSDRPITPVPDYVLDIHRRLCGREFTRVKSPTVGTVSSVKTKTRKEREIEKEKRAIDERAHDRALVRRRNREKENEHRLVVGSSQSHVDDSPKYDGKRKRTFSPVDMPRLAPVVVNTVHHTTAFKHNSPRHETTPRAAQSNAHAFSPSAVYNELCNPTPPRISTPPKSRQLRRIPTGTSPRSAIPITSPSPSPAPKPITPVKPMVTLSEVREFKAVPMQAETLLSWGGDSRVPIRPEPRPIQHHHPGVEEVDANETQSLAPSAASQSFPNIIPSPTRPVPAMFAHLDKPQARPQKRTSLIMPETIRPGTKSNTGVPTSRSIAKFPTNLGVSETILPPASTPKATEKSKASTARQSRSSGSASGWPAFGFDEITPTQAARSRIEESPISSSKKRKTTSATTGTQSKLAAFGFFGEKPKKAVRGFEEDWEMEDDLTFDLEPAPDAEIEDHHEQDQEKIDKRLQAVPAPPPHPSFRPAGLRELKRLEATRSTRPPFVLNHDNEHEHDYDNEPEQLFPEIQPSSSSSHTPTRHGGSSTSASASASSITTESELGMNSSAVAWWDGLEDRRSSEFESIPRLS